MQIIVLSRDNKKSIGAEDTQLPSKAYDNLTIIEVNVAPCSSEAKVKGGNTVPDNTLFNMGLDAASTNLVCISPPNVIFDPSAAGMLESQLLKKRVYELPYTLVVPVYYPLAGREGVEGDNGLNTADTSANRSSIINSGTRRTHKKGSDKMGVSTPAITESSEAITPAPLPYPSRDSTATQQTKQLLKPFHSSMSIGDALTDVAFNAKVHHPIFPLHTHSQLHSLLTTRNPLGDAAPDMHSHHLQSIRFHVLIKHYHTFKFV